MALACALLLVGCGQDNSGPGSQLAPGGVDAGGGGGQVGFGDGEGGADSAGSGGAVDGAGGQDAGAVVADGPKTIDIQVATIALVVGNPAKVRCFARDKDGKDLGIDDGWELLADKPLNVVAEAAGLGLAVVSEKAGKFPVQCRLISHDLTSNKADVRYVAGPAAKAVAKVEKDTIEAGDAGTPVSCELQDAFGNPTTTLGPGNADPPEKPAETKVDVPEDMSLLDGALKSTKAGTYDVTCGVAGADLQKVAAKVTVKPGPPEFSKATVKPAEAQVDVPIAVGCAGFDKYGNAVEPPLDGWDVDAGAGCKTTATASGGTLACTKAGKAEVRCKHKEIIDPVPSPVTILPGPPVSLVLKLDPEQPNYAHGQKIQLIGEGKDKYGNVDPDVALKPIKVSPTTEVVLDAVNAQVSFKTDGMYKVTAHAEKAPSVSAQRSIRVDTNGPLINVSSPKRGATLLWASKITVEFSVADELSGLGTVKINGVKPKVGDGIGIKHTIPVKQGMNVIKIEATDQFGNSNELVQSFYAARAYNKTEDKDAIAARVSNGLVAFLGQKALDSGYRNHSKPKDLATVVEIVLKNLDVKSLLGSSFPIDVTAYKGEAQIKTFKFGDPSINKGHPKIKLTATNSGLNLAATIYKILALVDVKGKSWWNPDITAEVTASSMYISGTIKVYVYSSGKAKVTTSNVTVKLNNLKVKVKNGWGWLVNWLISLFNGAITKKLESTIKEQIAASLDGPLAKALEAFALSQSFTLPGFFGAPSATIKLTSALQTLSSVGPSGSLVGGLKLGMKAALTSTRKVPHKILGSIQRRSCLKTYQTVASLPRKNPFELAMHLDLANQMFTSLWQAGGLKLKVPTTALAGVDLSQFQVKDVAVDAEFLLPPVVNDCTASGQPELQLGDVRLDVKAKLAGEPVVLRVYMSAAAKVKLVAAQGKAGKEIGLSMSPPHLLESDVDSVLLAGKPAPVATEAFFQQLLPLVAGQLIGLFQGTLASFPLPELDLSLLTAAIPKGTVLALDIEQVYSKPGNVHADGKVK